MAVRAFTAAHNLDCAVGALSTGTFGTIAAIVKRDSIGSWSTIYGVHASGGSTPRNQFAFNPANNILLWQDPNSNSSIGPLWSNTADWALFVVRKATGAGITPRFSLYNFTTGLWTHAAGTGSALENWATSPGGVVRFNWAGGDNFVGRIAARAAWNSLPWAADAGGDAALEAAGLHTSAANWLAASPNAMWLFNQAAVTDAVTDVTGNGADQTARTGTTVIAGDDPPGFNFSLTSAVDIDATLNVTAGITADSDIEGAVDIDATISIAAGITAGAEVIDVAVIATITAEAEVVPGGDTDIDVAVVATITAGADVVPGGTDVDVDAILSVAADIDADSAAVRGVTAAVSTVADIDADSAAVRQIAAAISTAADIDADSAAARGVAASIAALAGITAQTAAEYSATASMTAIASITSDAEALGESEISAAINTAADISATASIEHDVEAELTAAAGISADAEALGESDISASVDAVAAINVAASVEHNAEASVTSTVSITVIGSAGVTAMIITGLTGIGVSPQPVVSGIGKESAPVPTGVRASRRVWGVRVSREVSGVRATTIVVTGPVFVDTAVVTGPRVSRSVFGPRTSRVVFGPKV